MIGFVGVTERGGLVSDPRRLTLHRGRFTVAVWPEPNLKVKTALTCIDTTVRSGAALRVRG